MYSHVQTVKGALLEAQLREASVTEARDRAVDEAERATARAAQSAQEADENRTQRQQLESDIVGLKAWIRTMQVRGPSHMLACTHKPQHWLPAMIARSCALGFHAYVCVSLCCICLSTESGGGVQGGRHRAQQAQGCAGDSTSRHQGTQTAGVLVLAMGLLQSQMCALVLHFVPLGSQ